MSSFMNLIRERYDDIPLLLNSHTRWTAFFSVLSFTLAGIFCYYQATKPKQISKHLPGPNLSRITSNIVALLNMIRNKSTSNRALFLQLLSGVAELFRKEGMYLFNGVHKHILVLYSAKTVEPVLNSNELLSKGFVYDFFKPLLKEGLLTSKRDKWRQRRKFLTPAFHFRILDEFIPIFNEQANMLASKIAFRMNKEPFIDIAPLTSLCTLDIICETAMGKKIHAQENIDTPYVKALHKFCEVGVDRLVSPWLWLDFIYYRTKEGKMFKNTLKIMDEFTRQVIAERKAEKLKELVEPNSNQTKQLDNDMNRSKCKRRLALLDLLLDLHFKDGTFTLEDVAEEVDNFMFAGHDTTSSGIAWALYMLGLYPEIQKEVQQEVDNVIGDDESRQITVDDIKELKYLDCVMKETRRLWPPTPIIARDLDEDTVIDGYFVPKGTICAILIHMLHRDPKVFPNPEVFDPDRFLLENSAGRHPFAYIPFSAGPRNCIGQRFAMFEAITLMATILRKFNVKSLDPLDQLHIVDDLILRSETGLRMSFQLRKEKENGNKYYLDT